MDIAERFEVPAPVDQVWPHLRDIDAVAECFPGAELTGRDDDGAYAGRIAIKFGPTTATFSGVASIAIEDASRAATIDARGKDKRGSSRASALVRVRAVDGGSTTTVEIDGSIDVHGPLGAFASAGGAHITRVLLSDFAASMAARVAAAPPAPEKGSSPAAGGPVAPQPAPAPAATAPLKLTSLLRRSVAAWFRRLRNRRRATDGA